MPVIPVPPAIFQQPVVKPYVEFRSRFETRENREFNDLNADDRQDLLFRVRPGVQFKNGKWGGEVQFQFLRNDFRVDVPPSASSRSTRENRDLSLAYLDGQTGYGRWTIGRQKIAIAEQRLIGPTEWANMARSFDAVRFRAGNWDAFAFTVGLASPRPRDARVAGLVHTSRGVGTSMAVQKHDKTAAGRVDITTLDHVFATTFAGFAFDAEGAVQFGKNAGKDHEAWAVHARLARPLGGAARAFLEVNAASGGSDANTVRTFDNLYPTNHGKYGLLDTTGWRNMNHIALGVDFRPTQSLSAKLSFHALRLQDARDAWYGAGGAPNRHATGVFVDPTGAAGRDLGTEVDLDTTWTLRGGRAIQAGIGVFNPGSFVRNVGGRADRQVFGYVQFGARF